MTAQQLELHDEFETRGAAGPAGHRLAPGKTNVMAVRAVRELGRTPSACDVMAAGRDLDPPEASAIPYAVRTLLDELTIPPVVRARRRGGRDRADDRRGRGRLRRSDRRRPRPIHTLHSGVLTFPESFGCREC